MASKEKNTDELADKLAIIEAEVERLTAENESLQRQLEAARQEQSSVQQPRRKGPKGERQDTVIEYQGTFYRVTRPAFFALGKMRLATDLLTDTEGILTGQLMAEYPQLFAPANADA